MVIIIGFKKTNQLVSANILSCVLINFYLLLYNDMSLSCYGARIKLL